MLTLDYVTDLFSHYCVCGSAKKQGAISQSLSTSLNGEVLPKEMICVPLALVSCPPPLCWPAPCCWVPLLLRSRWSAQAKPARRRAEVKAEANASNAIPNAGAKQDPQVDKPSAVTKATKEEKLAARQTQSRYCSGRLSEQSEKSAQQPVGQRRHQCGNFCNASLQELMVDRCLEISGRAS
ncbi:hypothetical protein LP416_14140 [Polaromonas sp. P2-4]|nr:hypothetical protein LP416_14140 [Polaromonas sp. P2-4]